MIECFAVMFPKKSILKVNMMVYFVQKELFREKNHVKAQKIIY